MACRRRVAYSTCRLPARVHIFFFARGTWRKFFTDGFWSDRSRLKFFWIEKDAFTFNDFFNVVIVGLGLGRILKKNST
jgi:hypothetical protein